MCHLSETDEEFNIKHTARVIKYRNKMTFCDIKVRANGNAEVNVIALPMINHCERVLND